MFGLTGMIADCAAFDCAVSLPPTAPSSVKTATIAPPFAKNATCSEARSNSAVARLSSSSCAKRCRYFRFCPRRVGNCRRSSRRCESRWPAAAGRDPGNHRAADRGAASLGCGLEQQIVDGRLVLQGDGADRGRQGQDEVIVGNRQQLHLAVCKALRRRGRAKPS